MYKTVVKRLLDIVISLIGLIVLAIPMVVIVVVIKIDDPGPAIFKQKRVGKDKKHFYLFKFRSMKMSTPQDVPTHLLDDPEQYITKTGRFLRKSSLDEVPQLFNTILGQMSIIGPRPALWNQYDLIEERDKCGANDIRPGLTGWAQINGRDELEIGEKARFDGEYVERLSFGFDCRCFFGTIGKVLRGDGIVEGSAEEPEKAESREIKKDGYEEKKILITGLHSYVGQSFSAYADEHYNGVFLIDNISLRGEDWEAKDFSSYDAVFHVAGIAHSDTGRISEKEKQKYYSVNTELAIRAAEKAKKDGVKQFVLMSSMIVYGDCAKYGHDKVITMDTVPQPANFYGDSKWQADQAVRAMADDSFCVAVLRPPMIYGKGSKGNYPTLAKLAKKLPVFPLVKNERSMLYVENLCELLCRLMLSGRGGIYFPQNSEYSSTGDMVKKIAEASGRRIWVTSLLKPLVCLGSKIPGRMGKTVNKAFGNLKYEKSMSKYEGLEYQKVSLAESILRTESNEVNARPKALVLASVASMINQFCMGNIETLKELGFEVDVAANFDSPGNISMEKVAELKDKLAESGVGAYQLPFPRSPFEVKAMLSSLKEAKRLFREKKYKIIHCNSPTGGVVTRFAAKSLRKSGTKVIYTAHGFHFYKGAPLKNRLLYYPVEWLCSFWTDTLITINHEDYALAKKHMHAKRVLYVPGVGIDVERFADTTVDRAAKRREIGVPEDAFLLLSVGELNANKNHQIVIRALAEMGNKRIHYAIAGMGELHDSLLELAGSLGVGDRVHLLGYRSDVAELYKTADAYVLPSKREGLNVSLMEALASGLPCIASKIRGNTDMISDGVNGFFVSPGDTASLISGICRIRENTVCETDCYNSACVFDRKTINNTMKKIYNGFRCNDYLKPEKKLQEQNECEYCTY